MGGKIGDSVALFVLPEGGVWRESDVIKRAFKSFMAVRL
jgi:hypothetical protein